MAGFTSRVPVSVCRFLGPRVAAAAVAGFLRLSSLARRGVRVAQQATVESTRRQRRRRHRRLRASVALVSLPAAVALVNWSVSELHWLWSVFEISLRAFVALVSLVCSTVTFVESSCDVCACDGVIVLCQGRHIDKFVHFNHSVEVMYYVSTGLQSLPILGPDEYTSVETISFYDNPFLECDEIQAFEREHSDRFVIIHDVICTTLEDNTALTTSSIGANDTSSVTKTPEIHTSRLTSSVTAGFSTSTIGNQTNHVTSERTTTVYVLPQPSAQSVIAANSSFTLFFALYAIVRF